MLNQKAFLEAFSSILYSTLDENRATIDCFLNSHEIGIFSMLKINLLLNHVYFRSFT